MREDKQGQILMFPVKKKAPIEPFDVILNRGGGPPGMDELAVKKSIAEVGIKNTQSMIKSKMWRLTDKGDQYLKKHIKERMGAT